jgi:hypothetical protein
MKTLIIIAAIGLFSCSTKRYLTESINLKPQEDKYHVQSKLVAIKRTGRGFKHTFVTDKTRDTLYRTFQTRLDIDSCYMVWKTKLDK